MSELKACPFCNAEPLYYDGIVGADHKLNCPLYQMSIPVIEWESRPIEKALQKKIDTLRQNLEKAYADITHIPLYEIHEGSREADMCEVKIRCIAIFRKYNLIQEEK